ncbi:MAG: metallophosphatase [Clostridium sp.]|nr:metallophosphatase [Clostridium sp.]
MRTWKKGLMALWMCACAAGLQAQEAATAQGDGSLLVVHTNDTHSCVMPLNKNLSDTAQADKGGYLRRTVLLQQLRRQDPDLLLFDCGDFSQGSPYYNLFKGEVEVRLMNRMRYDACTIGNHEFDFGLENMRRIFLMADFPVVCANYGFEGTPLEGVVKPYVVLERRGLRIGVFGLSPEMEGLVAAENYRGVTYEDPVAVANRVAGLLKEEEHCDLVICLSHLGWDIPGMNDQVLIRGTRNIDMVLGGHSHTYFEEPRYVENADGQKIPCNQMGKNGRFVGSVRVN